MRVCVSVLQRTVLFLGCSRTLWTSRRQRNFWRTSEFIVCLHEMPINTTTSGNQPYYCNVYLVLLLSFRLPINFKFPCWYVHININQPMFSSQSPKQPNTISPIFPRSHRQKPRISETETIWFTPSFLERQFYCSLTVSMTTSLCPSLANTLALCFEAS